MGKPEALPLAFRKTVISLHSRTEKVKTYSRFRRMFDFSQGRSAMPRSEPQLGKSGAVTHGMGTSELILQIPLNPLSLQRGLPLPPAPIQHPTGG